MKKSILLSALFHFAFQNTYAQPAGGLDSSFNNTGIVKSSLAGATSIAIQSTGKILLAGLNGIARYNPDGSIDATFDNGGMKQGDFIISSMTVQGNDKFVVVSSVTGGSSTDFAVARYNSDGSVDNTFNGNGKLTTDFKANSNDEAKSVAIQSEGKIVLTGVKM